MKKKRIIYRVIVDFEYRNKSKSIYSRTIIKKDTIDTFALSKDKKEIYDYIESRMLKQINRKKKDVEIEITNIQIEGEYGKTNYKI